MLTNLPGFFDIFSVRSINLLAALEKLKTRLDRRFFDRIPVALFQGWWAWTIDRFLDCRTATATIPISRLLWLRRGSRQGQNDGNGPRTSLLRQFLKGLGETLGEDTLDGRRLRLAALLIRPLARLLRRRRLRLTGLLLTGSLLVVLLAGLLTLRLLQLFIQPPFLGVSEKLRLLLPLRLPFLLSLLLRRRFLCLLRLFQQPVDFLSWIL